MAIWDSTPTIIEGDCLDVLPQLRPADLIVADPPYNLGINYGNGRDADRLSRSDYLEWTRQWLEVASNQLSPTGTIWVIGSWEWIHHAAVSLEGFGLHPRNTITWYETFGVNCRRKFNRCGRPLLYYVRHPQQFTFNVDEPAIRRQSDRQTKYRDKRANPNGKLLDDVWTDIPRVCGTFHERVEGAPTQLPEALLTRIILATSKPGDLVVDPFCGTGTTLVAARRHGRRAIGIEKSSRWATVANGRVG